MSAQKGNILSAALQSGAFTDENLVNKMMAFLAAGHKPLQGQWHVQYTPISPSRQNPRLSSPSRRHNHSRHRLNARPSPLSACTRQRKAARLPSSFHNLPQSRPRHHHPGNPNL